MGENETLWCQSLLTILDNVLNEQSIHSWWHDGRTEVLVRFWYFCFSVAEWIEAWAIGHVKTQEDTSIGAIRQAGTKCQPSARISVKGRTWKMAIRGSDGREGGVHSRFSRCHLLSISFMKHNVFTHGSKFTPFRYEKNRNVHSRTLVPARVRVCERSVFHERMRHWAVVKSAGGGPSLNRHMPLDQRAQVWLAGTRHSHCEQAGELERNGALVGLCERSGEHRSSEHSSERTRPELEARKSQVTREATPQMADALCWRVGDSAHLSYIVSHVWRVNIVSVHTCEFV